MAKLRIAIRLGARCFRLKRQIRKLEDNLEQMKFERDSEMRWAVMYREENLALEDEVERLQAALRLVPRLLRALRGFADAVGSSSTRIACIDLVLAEVENALEGEEREDE